MTDHPRIRAIATASPPHTLHQDRVAAGAERLFAAELAGWSRFAPIYTNAEIATRQSCVPVEWYEQAHGFGERNSLYLRCAEELLAEAGAAAIRAAAIDPAELAGIAVVSSTGIATPSLDARLLPRLGLRPDTARLPLFGLVCAGGVLGLNRVAQMVRADQRPWLLLVVELYGLTFRFGDRSKSNLIATALFGDGAAALVVTPDGDGPAIIGGGEHTWPNSLDVMGWDVRDDGLGVVFSRDIPAWVRTRTPGALAAFLARHDLSLADIAGFDCHPGGAKVLDALEEVLGLPPRAWSTRERYSATTATCRPSRCCSCCSGRWMRAPVDGGC